MKKMIAKVILKIINIQKKIKQEVVLKKHLQIIVNKNIYFLF